MFKSVPTIRGGEQLSTLRPCETVVNPYRDPNQRINYPLCLGFLIT